MTYNRSLTCTTGCWGGLVGSSLPSSSSIAVSTKLKPRKSWWAPALGGTPGESEKDAEKPWSPHSYHTLSMLMTFEKKLPKLQIYCRELSLKIKMKLQPSVVWLPYSWRDPRNYEWESSPRKLHSDFYIIQLFISFLWHKRCWAEFSMKSNWMETIIRCNKSCKTLVNNLNLVCLSIRDILQFQKTWYI